MIFDGNTTILHHFWWIFHHVSRFLMATPTFFTIFEPFFLSHHSSWIPTASPNSRHPRQPHFPRVKELYLSQVSGTSSSLQVGSLGFSSVCGSRFTKWVAVISCRNFGIPYIGLVYGYIYMVGTSNLGSWIGHWSWWILWFMEDITNYLRDLDGFINHKTT